MRISTFRITNKIIKEILVFDSIHCSYLRVLFLLYEDWSNDDITTQNRLIKTLPRLLRGAAPPTEPCNNLCLSHVVPGQALEHLLLLLLLRHNLINQVSSCVSLDEK